jgi:hypothetical protein
MRSGDGWGFSTDWSLNCCWPSPAQRFLIPESRGIHDRILLSALGSFRLCCVTVADLRYLCGMSLFWWDSVLQVKPLQDAYQAALNAELTEAMNVFWAECYESSKAAVHRRNREVGESKLRFQVLPLSQSLCPRNTVRPPRYGRYP